MTRTRRPLGRGTRFTSGMLSGVTLVTDPSGVTIDYQGITTSAGLVSGTELIYLNGAVGYSVGNASAAKLCVSGVSYWAGTTVTLVTGLTAIESLICSVIADGAVSQAFTVKTSNINNNAGCASALLQFSLGTAGGTMPLIDQSPGCSIAFIAFGT